MLTEEEAFVSGYSGKTDKDGIKRWYRDGELHRDDGPAVLFENGHAEYWVNGKLHRIDGPAVLWADGTKSYWQNGLLHRTDGPAVEMSDGTKKYFLGGNSVDPLVVFISGHAINCLR